MVLGSVVALGSVVTLGVAGLALGGGVFRVGLLRCALISGAL